MLDDNTIKSLYDSNKLSYHNWNHVQTMLRNLDEFFKPYLSEESYRLISNAIKWHDVIYVPGATDNEERSAKAYVLHQVTSTVDYAGQVNSPAKRALSAVALTPTVSDEENPVYRLIMATKAHKAVKPDSLQLHALSKIIVDLDLWGLGYVWESYRINGIQIRQEFMDAGISDEDFNTGRKEWIKKFLERDSIYLTDFCQDRELRARYNLKKELYLLNLQEINGLSV